MHIQSPLNNGNNTNSLIMRCPALRSFITALTISGKTNIFDWYKKRGVIMTKFAKCVHRIERIRFQLYEFT